MDVAELVVITGPTAAGKSAIAMALAKRAGATIVSADSRQVYAGFDIGTSKPTREERAHVRHEGVDVARPDERWSAALWADAATGWIEGARAAGRPVIVVGGTGFYIKALLAPLAAAPALDPVRRGALADVLAALSTNELRRWTTQLDPARAHLGRTQLLRAVETVLLSGARLSDSFVTPSRMAVWSVRYLVVDPGPVLATRIVQRVDAMLAAGWVDEVRTLVSRVGGAVPAWNACGYEVLRAHVAGTVPLAAARERVIIATRQYAKRQRTWMRHQLPESAVTRLDPTTPDAMARAWAWYRAGGKG